MKFTELDIAGLILIEPNIHHDERGFFAETYNEKSFKEAGIETHFVQDNHSYSAKGALRGMHLQAAPKALTKLVRVAHGSALDAVVDVRPGSSTFGKCVTVELTQTNGKMLYVPHGCAHGSWSGRSPAPHGAIRPSRC